MTSSKLNIHGAREKWKMKNVKMLSNWSIEFNLNRFSKKSGFSKEFVIAMALQEFFKNRANGGDNK